MYSDGYIEIENAFFLRNESTSIPLSLGSRSTPALALFRVLLGGVAIGIHNSYKTVQKRNLLALDCSPISSFGIVDEISKAFPNLGVQDRTGNFLAYSLIRPLHDFFQATGTNKGFFEVLLNEVTRSLIASSRGDDLAAFVYVYRAIEHMSYALPFFHARHASNYIKAFNDLRALITAGDGELKFCDKFIATLFARDALLTTHKYSFKYEPQYFTAYSTYLKNVHKKHCVLNATDIEIPFLKAFGFVVDVRNKFFHHLSGSNQSATSKEIIDADAFFKPINMIARSMIALVFGKIISLEIQ